MSIKQPRKPAGTPGTPAEDGGQFARAIHDAPTLELAEPDVAVHTFYDTGEGYNECQTDDNIHDGDVLAVPREGVYGFLYEAWPVAVAGGPGHFHTADLDGLLADRPEYTAAVTRARRLAAAAGVVTDSPRFGDVDDPEADHDELNGSTLYI